jgi:hypothetical protein
VVQFEFKRQNFNLGVILSRFSGGAKACPELAEGDLACRAAAFMSQIAPLPSGS